MMMNGVCFQDIVSVHGLLCNTLGEQPWSLFRVGFSISPPVLSCAAVWACNDLCCLMILIDVIGFRGQIEHQAV